MAQWQGWICFCSRFGYDDECEETDGYCEEVGGLVGCDLEQDEIGDGA